jgi:hypothetical protein
VKPSDAAAAPQQDAAICCDVLAHAAISVPLDQFAALRRQPGPEVGAHLPANFLKHSDEQTVAGLASVLQAIHTAGIEPTSLGAWGIVAAPCFLGRGTLVASVARYAIEGAWGMSPHFIPHKSQHAVSGTISQALKIHGPNFGTGGGPWGAVEAVLAGAVLAETAGLPGVWVVFTGWNPEYVPNADGAPTAPVECQAVALALVRARVEHKGFRIRVVPPARMGSVAASAPVVYPMPRLLTLVNLLSKPPEPAESIVWGLEGGGWFEIGSCNPASTLPAPKTGRWSNAHSRAEVLQAGAGTEKRW